MLVTYVFRPGGGKISACLAHEHVRNVHDPYNNHSNVRFVNDD